MSVNDFTQSDLAEIYKRGLRTAYAIMGRPVEDAMTQKPSERQNTLEYYKTRKSDADFYAELAIIPFFAGMKAKIVEMYRDRIFYWFNDYRKVADYGDEEYRSIVSDPEMFRNKRKIRAAIENARKFKSIVDEYGSFLEYIFNFQPHESYENLYSLLDDAHHRFTAFGPTVTKHYFMSMDIGLPLIKPDLNMMRTFFRIGLVDEDGNEDATCCAAIRVAEAAGVSVTSVDTFVELGLKDFYYPRSEVCGLEPDCNREKNPCEIRELCGEWRQRNI